MSRYGAVIVVVDVVVCGKPGRGRNGFEARLHSMARAKSTTGRTTFPDDRYGQDHGDDNVDDHDRLAGRLRHDGARRDSK
jgi:hypothetical protein